VAQAVNVSADTLSLDFADGRSIAGPVERYPPLAHGSPAERNNWRFIGRGEGIRWPDLDQEWYGRPWMRRILRPTRRLTDILKKTLRTL